MKMVVIKCVIKIVQKLAFTCVAVINHFDFFRSICKAWKILVEVLDWKNQVYWTLQMKRFRENADKLLLRPHVMKSFLLLEKQDKVRKFCVIVFFSSLDLINTKMMCRTQNMNFIGRPFVPSNGNLDLNLQITLFVQVFKSGGRPVTLSFLLKLF